MEEIHRDVFYCKVCKATKDRRSRFNAIGILSMSSLPVLNIVFAYTVYLAKVMPVEFQIGVGAALFWAYWIRGVRLLGR